MDSLLFKRNGMPKRFKTMRHCKNYRTNTMLSKETIVMKSGYSLLGCRRLRVITQASLLALAVITTAGCNSLKDEHRYINVKPKPEPLSAEILQAMQPDSTTVLKKADVWLKNSGQLLDSVTTN